MHAVDINAMKNSSRARKAFNNEKIFLGRHLVRHKGCTVKVSTHKDYESITLADPQSIFAIVGDNDENKAEEAA